MGKYFKDDGGEEQSNAADRMDDGIDIEIDDEENDYDPDRMNSDWLHKKSHLHDDFSEN